MNLNEKVSRELEFVPVKYKDFRSLYQRERLKALAKAPNTSVMETFLKVEKACNEYPKVSAFLFGIIDLHQIIRDSIEMNFIAECSLDDILEWSCLPSGEVISIIRPSAYHGQKDFCVMPYCVKQLPTGGSIWDAKENNLYVLTTDTFAGLVDFTVYKCNVECATKGGRVHDIVFSNSRKGTYYDWDLEQELTRYASFVGQLKEFMANLKLI